MARNSFGTYKNALSKRVSDFSGKTFFQDKLNNWLGYLFIAALAILYAWLVSYNITLGLGLFAILIGIFVITICFTRVEFAFYLLMILSFFIYFISAFFFKGALPAGAIFDGMTVITLLSLLLSRKDFKDSWKNFIKIPLITYILLRFFFDVVEMFNPNSGGASATSIQGVRKFLEYNIILFAAYTLFDSYERIRKITFGLFICASLSALYGCIQQWHGLFQFELDPIMADPHAFGLLFVNGELRKFGTMSDPSAFGIVMAVSATFFLILGVYEKRKSYKYALFTGTLLMILAMGYSGTRTAYATIIAGIAFFILLNLDRPAVQKFGIASVFVFLIMLFGPGDSIPTVRRFRSTFVGTKDESFNVRTVSRHYIQPYVWSHPIGGGLGTTGFNGAIEHPGHFLANFMPDSSYLTKATETGWIGFVLILILYYWTLKVSIKGFFQVKDEKIKAYYSACASSLFAFYIAEFAQTAIGGISDVILYFTIVAIVLKLKNYDHPRQAIHA